MTATAVRTAPTLPGPTRTGLVLDVDHVTKRYGRNVVVDDVSFTVQPGRVTGFLGPNGSGKSTTMKILLDLAAANHGRATVGGRRYRELPDPARTVGVVLEPNAFHPGRSARNHLLILADTSGIPHSRVEETLELVGLGDAADRRVGAFSLGMRQRLSLAGALLGDPPVLVLDEPGNGLDPQGIRALRDLLPSSRRRRSHRLPVKPSARRGRAPRRRGHRPQPWPARHERAAPRAADRGNARPHTIATAADRRRSKPPAGSWQASDAETLVVRGMPIDAIGDVAYQAGVAIHELSTGLQLTRGALLGLDRRRRLDGRPTTTPREAVSP